MANRKTVITFWVYGALMLLYQWFYFDLYHWLTPGGMVYFTTGVIVFSFIMFSWAALHLCLKIKKIKRQALSPLVIWLCTLLVVLYFPFYPLRAALNYSFHFEARNQVVERIKSGELKAKEGAELLLPDGYKSLSRGGTVTVNTGEDGTLVRFYLVKSEAPDPVMSFVYTQSGQAPTAETLGETVSAVTSQNENWFYVVSYEEVKAE